MGGFANLFWAIFLAFISISCGQQSRSSENSRPRADAEQEKGLIEKQEKLAANLPEASLFRQSILLKAKIHRELEEMASKETQRLKLLRDLRDKFLISYDTNSVADSEYDTYFGRTYKYNLKKAQRLYLGFGNCHARANDYGYIDCVFDTFLEKRLSANPKLLEAFQLSKYLGVTVILSHQFHFHTDSVTIDINASDKDILNHLLG